jgi:ABC-2 type transport system permease protein
MTRLVTAELFKLRTTRTFYGLVGAELAAVVITAILSAALSHPQPGDDYLRKLEAFDTFALIVAALLGILSVTTEIRHGTITPTLLGAPVRPKLLAAKLLATLLGGLVLGLLTSGFIAGIVAILASVRDFDYDATGNQVLGLVLGGGVACALFAALGLGLGALVRNQVGAIIGGLVYLVVLEPLTTLIPTVGDWIQKYGLGGAATALSATGSADQDVLRQLPGGLLLLGYAAVFVIAGTVMVNKRDVSA